MDGVKFPRLRFWGLLVIGCVLLAMLPWIGALTLDRGFHGLPVDREAADFELSDGADVVTLQQLSDRPVFLTFGYKSCSQSCPVQWGVMQQLAEKLGKRAHYVWVSLDPLKDRKHALSDGGYVIQLFPETPQQSKQLAARYRVAVTWRGGADEGNKISHNDYIYLMDQHRNIRMLYQGRKVSAEDMTEDFNYLMGAGAKL